MNTFMTNSFMDNLEDATNFTYTENGAVTHKTTKSALLDMFAMGAAMRNRSDADVILMFKNAYAENPVYALKCLFYIRDVRGGQGERRFFRECMRWLANMDQKAAARNLQYVPEFGRWDDLYVFVGTPLEADAFEIMKKQLMLDMECKTPSLLAKWLKSENTSSKESQRLGKITRNYFGMTARQYRKTLSVLRSKINILERLMSENRWDEIEFDKIPSRAGMIYKNAFARHDLERAKSEKNVQTYEEFAKDTTKKVNAKALYPYECVKEAINVMHCGSWYRRSDVPLDDTQRLMTNKYWDNLADYFGNASFNGIAVVDTSGSMTGGYNSKNVAPIDVAISLGLYCAEHNSGPFANKYISFASRPQLISTDGVDFCDKVERIYRTNLVDNTNIEAVFDLLLKVARDPRTKREDIPKNVIIISDMEFDNARHDWGEPFTPQETLMEGIMAKWERYGFECPNLVYWNVDARHNNIPMSVKNGISFVSGFSPSIFEQIMSGKTAFDLMYEVLNKERYACIK